MDTGRKINKLRTEKGMTLEELGDMVGVGKSTVRKWETGAIANMKRDKILKVSEALNTTPAYLMGWEDNESDKSEKLPDNIYPIRQKKLRLLGEIACGEPIFCNEERESYVIAGTDIAADFCLKAKGDSMINARILDGDIVFIREQSSVDNGDIAAVIIEDEATLKRIYFDGTTFTLIAENPKYPPLVFSGETLNHVRILGKAIAFQSDVI